MAILKCKMCGGDLNFEEGATVVECEYCGTRQTVPNADSEKKITLFGRANRLRFGCEFDKASGVYESIVADFPEEAEAYWGLVLCKYGIEYVDDPATGKKVPTCHRSSFESVMEDDNFEQTLENADPIARSVYREEAKRIEELRKGIIEVSGREEPYDIFLCYKETAENGERTIDSVIAQDVYDELAAKGYRVFFSRITLEDKLGQEYEPYIFAALNSAKIMLAFGTDYEYYNAVWVRNEWSRFLQLIAKGEKKTLIPCYKGIDAYDMPKEFAKLQAQDMGKVGAVQDLLRGIEKLLPKKGEGEAAQAGVLPQQAAQSATADSLLKRAHLYLEDQDWKNAADYCNRVLDITPENAEAYLGLLMAELRVGKEAELGGLTESFGQNKHFLKAVRFAVGERRKVLEGYRDAVEAYLAEQQRIAEEKLAEQQRIEVEKIKEREERKRLQAEIQARIQEKQERLRKEREEREKQQREEKIRLLAEKREALKKTKHLIDAGMYAAVGVKSDGTVILKKKTFYGYKLKGDKWKGIIAVAASSRNLFGLKANGSVVDTVSDDVSIFSEWYRDRKIGTEERSKWRDIVAIAADDRNEKLLVGLRTNGTVVASRVWQSDDDDWKAVQREVAQWTDIVAVATSSGLGGSSGWSGYFPFVVGLKSNGTVVVTSQYLDRYDYKKAKILSWRDIVDVVAGDGDIICLKADGTVVSTDNFGQEVFSKWNDIVAVAGRSRVSGLKLDGTVVSVREGCGELEWKNIIAIAERTCCLVGLRADGTVVQATWENKCEVLDWKLL